ncbi:DUF167 family protein [Aquabacter sp. CN5-332]|uniref:DUF167 family protein n=1 Tax=Aquabacter sp. CN5-332 TaxID=3156608 RepID=UPI0032B4F1DF
MAFWTETPEGLEVRVRVTPKGGRDGLDGIAQLADGRDVLKVRVRVAPEDGAANAALGKLLAGAAGVAPSQAALISGATARVKTFRLKGDAAAMRRAIEGKLG